MAAKLKIKYWDICQPKYFYQLRIIHYSLNFFSQEINIKKALFLLSCRLFRNLGTLSFVTQLQLCFKFTIKCSGICVTIENYLFSNNKLVNISLVHTFINRSVRPTKY